MMRQRLIFGLSICFALVLGQSLPAGEYKIIAGPQPGSLIPGSFHPFNINGPFGKKAEDKENFPGRHHCLVVEYGVNPVAVVFTKEPKNDKMLGELLKRLDEAVEKDATGTFRSFAVFLSPWGTDSVIEASLPEEKRTKDPDKLIKLSIERDGLISRLEQRVADWKLDDLVVTYYPEEGPPKYDLVPKKDPDVRIPPKLETVVILYVNFKVHANFTFAQGKMTQKDIDRIMEEVDVLIGRTKKIDSAD